MLIVAGLLTGILIGLSGIGGGSLMTPLLLLVFGVAPGVAVGTDLWFAAATKSVAVASHRNTGLIDWQVVRRLWCGSLPAAALTLAAMDAGWLALDTHLLRYGIGWAVLITGAGMLLQTRLQAWGRSHRLQPDSGFLRLQAPLTVLAGAMLGVVVSLTSIGAGAFGAVLLAYLYPLRMVPAKLVATDIAHAVPLALVAGAGHIAIGQFDWVLLAKLLAGSIPGVLIGVRLAHHLPQQWLSRVIAVCLLAVGAKLVFG